MSHRIASLEIKDETVRAVLEDDTPERHWTDLSCGMHSPTGKTLILAHERKLAVDLIMLGSAT